MSRFIDAEVFADRLLNAWTTADKEKKSEIVAILSDIVTPILAGTPTADVAPREEVAREILGEIDTMIFGHIIPNESAIISIAKLAELKKKYTEGRNER